MSDQVQKGVEHVVFCDMCSEGDGKPAHKTCMKCEISMCVQHLQAHLTTPVLLQTHPLTEPMALCGTSKCPQHGKLLEYYCLDDMTCVCVSCAIEDQHRLHNMKTFPTAHKELMEKLNAEQRDLQVKTRDDDMSLEKWETSEREKLSQRGVRLVEAATRLRDLAFASIQSSVSARMVSIKTSRSSMHAAQEEKDTFRFLQMYSQVHQDVVRAKSVDLRRGLEPGSARDKLVEEIRQSGEKMVQQADQFWCSLLTLVDPENHSELVDTSSNLVFQLKDLDDSLSLSPDRRKVFTHNWMGQCNGIVLIQSDKSARAFQRWVVHLSADCDWTMGLRAQQSVALGGFMSGDIYGMSCTGDEVSSIRQSSKTKLAVTRPETVEVYWDIGASSLSFYNRPGWHKREAIVTIKMSGINSCRLQEFIQLQKLNKSQKHMSMSRNERFTELLCELL